MMGDQALGRCLGPGRAQPGWNPPFKSNMSGRRKTIFLQAAVPCTDTCPPAGLGPPSPLRIQHEMKGACCALAGLGCSSPSTPTSGERPLGLAMGQGWLAGLPALFLLALSQALGASQDRGEGRRAPRKPRALAEDNEELAWCLPLSSCPHGSATLN